MFCPSASASQEVFFFFFFIPPLIILRRLFGLRLPDLPCLCVSFFIDIPISYVVCARVQCSFCRFHSACWEIGDNSRTRVTGLSPSERLSFLPSRGPGDVATPRNDWIFRCLSLPSPPSTATPFCSPLAFEPGKSRRLFRF